MSESFKVNCYKVNNEKITENTGSKKCDFSIWFWPSSNESKVENHSYITKDQKKIVSSRQKHLGEGNLR